MANRDINNLYNFYQYILRKERGVFCTPTEFNANMYAGILDAVNEWFAPYGEDQILHDALRPIRVYYQFTSDSSGFVTYPNNYIHILGSPFSVTGSTVNQIKFVNEDELPFALTSQLRAVTNTYPIAVDTNVGFSIYPQQTQIGFFNYLKLPDAPIFGYTQVGRVITYDVSTSVQVQFSDIYVNNIIAKALRYAGVNMDEKGVSDFANQYNQETETK